MTTVPPDGHRNRRRLLLAGIIAAAVVLAVVLILVITAVTGNGDETADVPGEDQRNQAAIAYVNAINTGDPATVCRLETERQRGETQEACEKRNEYLRKRNVKADEPKVVATKQLAEGVGVLVEYRLTTGGATPSHDALRMLKQGDGSWLVDEADSADSEAMATGDPLGAVLGERRGAQ